MAAGKPILIVFGISHFCEKARWALDWHGVSYNEIGWPPGLHRALLKYNAAKGTSLPVVLDGDLVIEGSGAIIDWAERKAQDQTRSLNPRTGDLAEVREIERRADEVLGSHVRRLVYAETLPHYSHLVRPALFLSCSTWHHRIGSLMWPVTRRIMMRMYDIRPGAASESRAALESELNWLDARLSDGRFYLVGDRFSRADLTVASLLAVFAGPKEMPVYHRMRRPDALAADIERWRPRPAMQWIVEQYRRHRDPSNVKPRAQ
jgi:glutathione S-transferase